MSKRTDIHRPSTLVPADYQHVLSFAAAGTDDGWPVPPINVDVLDGLMERERFFRRSKFTCHVCGAHFRFGDVFRHVSGEHIVVGWECGQTIDMLVDHSGVLREAGSLRDAAMQQARRRHIAEAAMALLADNDGLEQDLAGDHDILRDLSEKLRRYGRLSDAQIGLARKIAAELRAPKKASAEVPVGEERRTVRGTVISLKVVDGQYRDTLKMLVEVDTEAGAYRVFGSVPSGLNVERGSVVEFVAKVERSQRDATFGFFSRPAKARVLVSNRDA